MSKKFSITSTVGVFNFGLSFFSKPSSSSVPT
jgi:hypothetical protein